MKYAYIAHDLGTKDFEFPTGRMTRYHADDFYARSEALKSGFDHFSVEAVCICWLYRQNLSDAWKSRDIIGIIKHATIGAIKYIQFKLTHEKDSADT